MAKVLVVDDQAANRELVATLIKHRKHQPLEAADGAEALALVRAERPELVISDILMPTMDGYEFVRQLRADPALAATEVIFYTAHYREREARNLAKSCGVSRVLIKPCEPEAILDAIDQALVHAPEPAPLHDAHEFDREHLRLMSDKLSEKVGELESVNRRLSALTELNLQLASERGAALLEKVCRGARDLIGAKYAVIRVNHKNNGDVIFFTSGIESGLAGSLACPEIDKGWLGEVLAERRARRMQNPDGSPTTAGLPPGYPRAQSSLAAPVVSPSQAYGWIFLANKLGAEEFSGEDEQLLSILAAQAGRIYENGSLYAQVRRHAEQLEESESRFRHVTENIRDVFFLEDAHSNRILYVSPAYEEIWGRSCESLYAAPDSWAEALHPDDRASVNENYTKGKSAGRFEYEYRIVRPDGSIRSIQSRGFPVRDERGEIVRIAGVAEDITERKRVADELRESDRRFRDMLGNVEMVSTMLDTKARITYCNDYLLRLTGWRREEVIGRDWFELFIPPNRDDLPAVFAALLANNPTTWHYENEMLTRSGGRRLISWNNSVLRSGDGVVIGVASLGEDITERKRGEEDLRRARDEALLASRAKSEFMTNMSHELRTPLNGVLGMIELLLDSPLDPAQREAGETVRSSAMTLTSIISGILDFSNIAAGALRLEPEDFDVQQLVAQSTRTFADQAVDKGLGFSVRLDASVPATLRGDAGRLRQVLTNLISNAVKFTERGAVETVVTLPSASTLRFEVRDTGSGITRDVQQRLFQPFVQADMSSTRKFGGTGMGLALCKRLVELMGGEIGVDSEPERGSTFWFAVRVGLADGAAATTTPVTKVVTPLTGNLSSCSVLIVEDNPINQLVTRKQLQRFGLSGDFVEDGQQAVEAFRRQYYDLIFMDCQMPGMDGYAATAEIRRQRGVAHPWIVAVTTHAGNGEREKCLAAGMDDYVAKPVSAQVLQEVLARFEDSTRSKNDAR
jgi:PAS domain S-box-containing protein